MAKYLGIPLTVSNGNKTPFTAQPEIITNGDFSHPTDAWTFGTNTSIVGGKLVCTSSAAYSPTYQAVTISKKAYVVTFTIDSISGGSVTASFQNSKNLTPRSVAGTYTEKVVLLRASTRFDFYTTVAGVSFEISNVSVKEIAATETPTYGSPEYVTNGEFADNSDWNVTHGGWATSPSAGSWACDGTQVQSTNLGQAGVLQGLLSKKVVISFEITARTAGTVRFITGDNNSITGDAESSIGTHETIGFVTKDGAGYNINIQADSDFVGSVSNVSVKEIPFVEDSNLVTFPYTQSFNLEGNWSAVNSLLNYRGDGTGVEYAFPKVNLEFGKTYRVKFDVLNKTSGDSAGISNTGYFSGVPASQRITTSTGNTTIDFVAVLEDVGGKADEIRIVGQASDAYTVSNFSVTEVQYNYLQVADGGFTKSVKEGDVIFNTSTSTEGVVKQVIDNNVLLMSNDNFSTVDEFFNVFAANGDARGNQVVRTDNYIMSEYDENASKPQETSFWFAGGVNADKVVLTQLNNATNTFFVAGVIEEYLERLNAQSATASRLDIPLDAFRDHEYNEVLTTTAITLS